MNPTTLALIGYITWFLILLSAIALYRTILTLNGNRAANSFAPEGTDISPLSGFFIRFLNR